jgi:UDP-N-acetylmuramate dehydrogenase
MMDQLAAVARDLEGLLEGKVATGVDLAPYTTYRLGGPAAVLVEPAGPADLEALGRVLREVDLGEGGVPVLPLGRGSNTVISEHGFPGIVIRLGSGFAGIETWDPPDLISAGAVAGAAVSLPQFANWAARRGLTGIEWAIAIPGSVGGGVRMNAGAHGGEMKDVVVSVRIWQLEHMVVEERLVEELDYGYRHCNLTDLDLVVEARFALQPDDVDAIRGRMEGYRRHRAQTQPGALQNAGSVFRNPPGDSAGRLVESAGLKGFRVGGAMVSELHANFFIAGDSATPQDVRDLVSEVRRRVAEVHGVELEPEIRFIGEFDR